MRIAPFLIGNKIVELGSRGADGRVTGEPADDVQRSGAAIAPLLGVEVDGRPDLRAEWNLKSGRRDADDFEWLAVHANRAADDGSIRTELARPQDVRQGDARERA